MSDSVEQRDCDLLMLARCHKLLKKIEDDLKFRAQMKALWNGKDEDDVVLDISHGILGEMEDLRFQLAKAVPPALLGQKTRVEENLEQMEPILSALVEHRKNYSGDPALRPTIFWKGLSQEGRACVLFYLSLHKTKYSAFTILYRDYQP